MRKTGDLGEQGRRGRSNVPFPGLTFETVLPFAKAIWDHAGASREMKRETLFEILNKAPESGPSRMLIRNSGRYGLTIGGEKSQTVKLSDRAIAMFDSATPPPVLIGTKLDLAINSVDPFKLLYERFQGGNLPAVPVMMDSLLSIPEQDRQRCVDIFLGNAKYIGLILVRSGSEYLAKPEEVGSSGRQAGEPRAEGQRLTTNSTDFSRICFVITPIGEEGTEKRKHADMMLSLIERALEPLKLEVVRADKITTPGMISKQIIEYLHKSKLVVADLSFGNQNVYYELALRHLTGLPIVHTIRRRDSLPFDVQNFRTVIIDDEDMYDLIAKLDTYRADLANHAREAVETGESTDNPILTFFPDLRVKPGNTRS